jgi:tetratricopeptide (TPR) repeat protein
MNLSPADQTAAVPPQPAGLASESVTLAHAPDGIPTAVTEAMQVPGYEILGELGRGGMGVVYKARQIAIGRVVALKRILAGGHAGPGDLLRFQTEAEAIARLQHPNIVQVYEVGEHNGLPYFSLEFCAGGTLDIKLGGTPLPAAEAARLAETLARAVEAAHAKQVIHRDLKPANVLLLEDGTPKITDFGLAKKLDEQGQTQSGSILGTPSYMAPEQAGGKGREIGPLCDVYALGAILYESLTGRPPFKAATPVDTLLQVLSDEPVPPRRLQPKTPRDLETICLKCLQKDPKKRYPSAQALAEDLRRFGAGEPIRARAVTWWGRAAKWVRRRPAVAGLLLICGAALFALGVGAWQYGVHLRQHARLLEAALGESLQQRQTAQREHDRAQANLTQALEALPRLLKRLDSGPLAELPEFHEQRREMVEEALAFYQGLMVQEGEDPALRRETARAHTQSAMLHLLLAQTAEAGRDVEEALRMQEALATDFPDRPEYRHDLALTHLAQGHAYTMTGRYDLGPRAYGKALELTTELIREHPTEAKYRESLVNAHRFLGLFAMFREPQLAEQHLRQAVEQAVLLGEAGSASPERQCLVAAAHSGLGLLLFSGGRLPEATRELDEAQKWLEPAGGRPPRSAEEYGPTRAQTLLYRGAIALSQGRPTEAEPLLRDGIAAYEQVIAQRPKFFPYRFQLLRGYQFQAQLYEQSGRLALADSTLQKAAQLAEQTARDHPIFRFMAGSADSIRTQQWLIAVRRGQYTAAMAEVERQASRTDLAGDYLYNLACVSALASAAARSDQELSDPQRRELAEEYAGRAVVFLNRLNATGYFRQPGKLAHAGKDSDLDPLRQRADFQAWLAAAQKTAPPPSH